MAGIPLSSETLWRKESLSHAFAPISPAEFAAVNGTPTFFIGGIRHDGPFDFDTLVDAIEQASTAEEL